MSVAIVRTRAVFALEAPLVTVEVHLSAGLPAFNLVGLPETAVRESRDRVRSAIINSQFEFPARRITVNLAPADLPKDGGRFDLAIALGILAASNQIPIDSLNGFEFLGELALTGELRPVRAVISAARLCDESNRVLILPEENGFEAKLAIGHQHLVAGNLLAVCAHLRGVDLLTPSESNDIIEPQISLPDMADIQGQQQARHVLEIAAAGGHNLLYEGPPGCGKSMLAQRLPSIMPAMEKSDALTLLAIQSLQQAAPKSFSLTRPFRAPHHSATMAAMVGGSNPPQPGEISLAHQGVLFLDELPEFQRNVLEALREPLETRQIAISRAGKQAIFPADFQLIAAMNPCPCGYAGSNTTQCQCSLERIARYRQKISGPLLDRIDLHLVLQATPIALLTAQEHKAGENSRTIQARVQAARIRQLARQGCANAQLQGQALNQHLHIKDDAKQLLERLAEKMQLSARALQRVLRVARTIADLANHEKIESPHITEACSYRQSLPPRI